MTSQNFQTSYQPLEGYDGVSGPLGSDDDAEFGRNRPEDLSPDSTSEMVFHVVPKSSKLRWNHIEDLDTFFKRVYLYHQRSGFFTMAARYFFELFTFLYGIIFVVFLVTCIDYAILFRNKLPADAKEDFAYKVTIYDTILSSEEITANFTFLVIFFIVIASIIWLIRLGYVIFILLNFWDIKQFFENALKIKDHDLTNVTWEEVQQRLIEVQVEQRMCIHKEVLTELDIYHRILRFTNYFIAMVNKKSLIPLKIHVPFMGEYIYLTKGLRFNIDLLLFWGPWSPFKNNWNLSDEYKRPENRQRLAEALADRFKILAIVNLILSPIIFAFQLLHFFFSYADSIKRDPGMLSLRRWSHYGTVYLRHFNELDHELAARLCRGYKAASQYMNIFSSPLMHNICSHLSYIFGSVAVVIAVLTVYDEDVLQVEHVLTILTVCGLLAKIFNMFVPDENMVFAPELLMRKVLGEVHYIPDHWREKAHTSMVRTEFSQLFQYKITHLIENLFSPLLTPYILYFKLRNKSLEIVDFLRNFTVEVVGVGDVCSFAQMDIRQHGSPTWQPDALLECIDGSPINNEELKTDGGKTELSLLHFTMMNPKWNPPKDSSAFINALKTQAQRDMNALNTVQEENALLSSLNDISLGAGLGGTTTSMVLPWMRGMYQPPATQLRETCWPTGGAAKKSVHRTEGSRYGNKSGILSSLQQSLMMNQSSVESRIGTSTINSESIVDPVMAPSSVWNGNMMSNALPQDLTAIDMSLSTMYLHEIHHRRRQQRTSYRDEPAQDNRGTTAFQNVPFGGTSFDQSVSGSGIPSVSYQRAQERTPLIPDP